MYIAPGGATQSSRAATLLGDTHSVRLSRNDVSTSLFLLHYVPLGQVSVVLLGGLRPWPSAVATAGAQGMATGETGSRCGTASAPSSATSTNPRGQWLRLLPRESCPASVADRPTRPAPLVPPLARDFALNRHHPVSSWRLRTLLSLPCCSHLSPDTS